VVRAQAKARAALCCPFPLIHVRLPRRAFWSIIRESDLGSAETGTSARCICWCPDNAVGTWPLEIVWMEHENKTR
jgi:hypothetical protein